MAVHLEKGKNVFVKAIYVGFMVLELSKVLLYNLHYDVMRKIYGTEIQWHIYGIKIQEL